MNKPTFQQLSGLLSELHDGLRGDKLLVTGSGVFDLGFDPDQVVHTTSEHQLIDVQKDGYIPLHPDLLGKTRMPCLAIWVREGEAMDVRGASSGTTFPMSLECDLGLQYLFIPPAQDRGADALQFTTRFAMTVFWKIGEILLKDIRAEASTLRDTHNIESIGIGSYRLLPPMGQGVHGFEADLAMSFKRPPWMTGADSINVVDMGGVDTDLNETGPTGADAFVQGKYDVPAP